MHVCICLPAYILVLSASLFFCWVHAVSTHRSAMFPSFFPLMIYVSCQNAVISAVSFFFLKKKNTNSRHVAIDTKFCLLLLLLSCGATWPLFIPLLFFNELLFFLLKPRHCYGKNNNLRFKYKILRLKGPKISKWRIFGLVWIFLREFETPIILFYFILFWSFFFKIIFYTTNLNLISSNW